MRQSHFQRFIQTSSQRYADIDMVLHQLYAIMIFLMKTYIKTEGKIIVHSLIMDRVKIIIQRHKNNYFKNWSTQELTFPQYLLQYAFQQLIT
jgi:hypothetical protein